MIGPIADAVEQIDGIDVVFFITPKDVHHFEGKQIDYSDDGWFFLRDR